MSDLERAYEAADLIIPELPSAGRAAVAEFLAVLGIDPDDLASLRKQHSPEWNHHSRWRWVTDWKAAE